MMEKINYFLMFLVVSLFGSDKIHAQWIICFLVLIGVDFILGIVKSILSKKFRRVELLKGFIRKICEILLISLSHMFDILDLFQGVIEIQHTTIIFLIGYESLSIISKFKYFGVPIPNIITTNMSKIMEKKK